MNKVVLIGNITRDPELNFAAGSGTAVCKFSLAVKRPFKKDETDFINCIAFNKTGETIAQYFTKGKPIALTGSIRTGSYDAKDGTKRYTSDVIIDSFEFIGQGKGEKTEVQDPFSAREFKEQMTPEDDGDCPF